MRRPGSVRRTSSLQVSWADASGKDLIIVGAARDLLTLRLEESPRIIAENDLTAVMMPDKTFKSISTSPTLPVSIDLAGQHAVSGFRRAILPVLADREFDELPLRLLLDDLVGINIISGWLAAKWQGAVSTNRRVFENVCAGYASGSTALDRIGFDNAPDPVQPLPRQEDPHSFHEMGPDLERTVRRVRRIDLWRGSRGIAFDAMFQDSGVLPGLARTPIHEYRLAGQVHETSQGLVLGTITATPGVLPYSECFGAPAGLQKLVGTPLTDLRKHVLVALRGPVGCTHLNDAVRSLAEIHTLYRHLPRYALR